MCIKALVKKCLNCNMNIKIISDSYIFFFLFSIKHCSQFSKNSEKNLEIPYKFCDIKIAFSRKKLLIKIYGRIINVEVKNP